MAKILRFVPPPGTLRRLLQRSVEMAGGKITGDEPRADTKPAEVLPLFRQRRRQKF